jgi:uncharacterized protein (TIGR02246 family)
MKAGEVKEREVKTDEAQIRALIEDWADAVRAKNIDRCISHYAKDILSFDLAPPLQYTGSDALRKSLEEWFPTFDGPVGYEIRELDISVGSDTAFSHSINHISGKRTNGEESDVWVRATVGFRKVDGRWLVTHEHVSVPFYMDGSYRAAVDLKPSGDREIVITRVFDAPRSLVFKAWIDPAHVAQWWGPHGFTNPLCELDVRPGGAIRIHMRGPDGTIYPMEGVYQEIVEPGRLVFTSAALDEEGNPLFEVLNTVALAEQGGKTTQTLRARVFKTTAGAAKNLEGMEAGWTQGLERLEKHVAKI